MDMSGVESESSGASSDEACRGAPGLVDSVMVGGWGHEIARDVSDRVRSLSPFQAGVRTELGLPLDRPIVMSGHQAEIWHPGILAKWIAGVEIARRLGGVFVWLHVDQDVNEPGVIEAPAIDARGCLVKRALTLVEPTREVPTGSRPAQRIDPARIRPRDGATPTDPEALLRLVDALNRHANEPTLALQFGRAVLGLASRIAPGNASGREITTSDLARTGGFGALVELLRDHPARAIATHNEAAARVPDAGVRALGLKGEGAGVRGELPLWRVARGSVRTPVMVSQIGIIPAAELRPRALLMTGLARLGACDLFIHGAGGAVYDRITDDWFERWLEPSDRRRLGVEDVFRLAPIVVATATARLAFGVGHGGVAIKDARAARHRAHAAQHDPALLGDEFAARQKRDIVARIRASPDRAERLALYQRMHALLASSRQANVQRLTEVQSDAEAAERRAGEEVFVQERTWPIALYPDATLEALAKGVRGSLE